MRFPELDPAKADMAVGELEEAFERLFQTMKAIEAAGRS